MGSSDLVLYHVPPSRSCRVLWAIHELGLPVNVIKKNFLEDWDVIKTEDFLKINPIGKLPALTDKGGSVVVTESCAAILYLLEQYGNGKLEPPKSDAAARARFLTYMFLAETELAMPLEKYFWHGVHPTGPGLGTQGKVPELAENGKQKGLQAFDVLEKELADKEYILGSEFTAADIAVGYSTAFLKMVQLDDEERYPNVRAYNERLSKREAFGKVFGS